MISERSIHEEVIILKEAVKARVLRQGKSKPKIESINGDDFYLKTGKWYNKIRIVDEEKDYYRETIANPETGEIIHHQEHKLGEHRGYGSAKNRPESSRA